jgi:peptidoglycan/LPS O-acetylase OafA/YrhL
MCASQSDAGPESATIPIPGMSSHHLRWQRIFSADPLAASNPLVKNLAQREIPSLYGLRGLAALVVVLYHYCLDWKICDFPGYYSVTLFFELSGLLITWLLLREIDLSRTIDRKQFYIRRSLRLFPVFYVVWAICRIGGAFPGSWAYFFYLGDYFTALTGKYSVLTSAWSLGVEEKFYLIWPQLVIRAGLTALTRILIVILLAEPVYRWALTLAGHEYYTHFAFETNLDPIVLGCLIAVLAKRGWSPPRWMLYPVSIVILIATGIALWRSLEIMMLVLAITLIYVICKPPRLLNNGVARFLGVISYSLYLCHEYTASVLWPYLFGSAHRLPSFVGLPLQMLLAIAAATVLHFAVERPFLRLKDHFHPRSSRVPASV